MARVASSIMRYNVYYHHVFSVLPQSEYHHLVIHYVSGPLYTLQMDVLPPVFVKSHSNDAATPVKF